MNLHAQDIAQYLADHPDFFDQHPELLSAMQLPHPHNGQAISLVERQSLMLRERIRALELKIAEMVRHGQENDAIADKLVRWSRALLLEADPAALPATLIAELKREFDVPYAGLRLWATAGELLLAGLTLLFDLRGAMNDPGAPGRLPAPAPVPQAHGLSVMPTQGGSA